MNSIFKNVMSEQTYNDTYYFFSGSNDGWKKEFGFNYPGEALERFLDRKVCTTIEEVRSFVYGAIDRYSLNYEAYDSQRENLGSIIMGVEEFKNDGLLVLLVGIWNDLNNYKKFESGFEEKLNDTHEYIAAISLLLEFSNAIGINSEDLNEVIFKLVQNVDVDALNQLDVYQRVDVNYELALVYNDFRPKKSDFKGHETIYNYVLHVWRLSKTELKVDVFQPDWQTALQSYKEALKCSFEEIIILNHLMLDIEAYWSKISSAAKQRVLEEYLKLTLTNTETITKEEKQTIQTAARKLSIADVSHWIHLITDEEKLTFIIECIRGIQNLPITTSLLSILDNPLLKKSEVSDVIEKVISHDFALLSRLSFVPSQNMKQAIVKDDDFYQGKFNSDAKYLTWKLVEEKRKEVIPYKGLSTDYVEMLIKMEFILPVNFSEIESLGLSSSYKNFVSRMSDTDLQLEYITYMPNEEREYNLSKTQLGSYSYGGRRLFDVGYFKRLKPENKATYVQVVLETVLHTNPHTYADELATILKNSFIMGQLDITESSILELLKFSSVNNLFVNEYLVESMKEKFMDEDDLQLKKKNEYIAQLKEIDNTYDFNFKIKDFKSFKDFDDVKENLVTVFENVKFKFKPDLLTLYTWVNKQAESNEFNEIQISRLMNKLNSLITENISINGNQLKFYLHAYSLQLNKEIQNTEENQNEIKGA